MFKSHDFQKSLLKWYDRHRRDLPWRARAGVTPNPYHVWLSEIMLQQTTVATVIPYFNKFTKKWPTLQAFAKADREEVLKEWAGLGYYARARNLHKCAQVLSGEYKSVFPQTEEELRTLPGIGAYTSAAIMAIAFDQPAVVIDGNVDRITVRVFAIDTPIKESKSLIREKAALLYEGISRAGDFAQSLMDLGSSICVPQNPRCGICPVNDFCKAYKNGLQDSIPAKAVKKVSPQRQGIVYWLETKEGEIALERRVETRMLGGMTALPTTGWDGKEGSEIPEKIQKKLEYIGDVYHSFTHFDLKLEIWRGFITKTALKKNLFVSRGEIENAGLPTVFKKAMKVMLKHE